MIDTEVKSYIEEFQNNVETAKSAAILEMYWSIGETLLKMKPLPNEVVDDFVKIFNDQIDGDPLFLGESTNSKWIRLAAQWVEDHSKHDRSIILSGKANWTEWALVLDIIKSPAHRYWMICQKIKNNWSRTKLVNEASSLPREYTNIGNTNNEI